MSSWQQWNPELEKWPTLNIKEYQRVMHLLPSNLCCVHILYNTIKCMCHHLVFLSFWHHSWQFCKRQCSGCTVSVFNRPCKPFSVQISCWGPSHGTRLICTICSFQKCKHKVSVLLAHVEYQTPREWNGDGVLKTAWNKALKKRWARVITWVGSTLRAWAYHSSVKARGMSKNRGKCWCPAYEEISEKTGEGR